MKKIPLLFNHSAAIDDFVATAVLATMDHIDLKGIVVVNADCIAQPAMDISTKVHELVGFQEKNIPLTLSDAKGWNSFPYEYRADCIKLLNIDSLKPFKNEFKPAFLGSEMVKNILENAIKTLSPVTVLATAPITAITDVLLKNPELKEGIKEIIWMGGAINVKGNLDDDTVAIPKLIANKKAEWNAFWDPFGVDIMLKEFTKIRIFPLDITDKAPITKEFMDALKQQASCSPLSQFVFEIYNLIGDAPFYRMWNTVATCCLAKEQSLIFNDPEEISLTIEKWGNLSQGWVHQLDKSNNQLVYLDFINIEKFYNYVLNQLKLGLK